MVVGSVLVKGAVIEKLLEEVCVDCTINGPED